MFGTKLRTWMEAHIVRSKKKKDRKKEEKGLSANSDSPRSRGTNRSPAFYQVHPTNAATKNVGEARLHGESSRCGTVSAFSTTSAGTGSVNLSSPESAYSTGYSTDGTSPGTSYPPEYYINIRTGTHYFQSNASACTGTTTSTNTTNTTSTSSSSSNNNNNNNSNNYNNKVNNDRSKRVIGSPELSTTSFLIGRRHRRYDVEQSGLASASGIFAASNATLNELRTNTSSKVVHGTLASHIVVMLIDDRVLLNCFIQETEWQIGERLSNDDGIQSQVSKIRMDRERYHQRNELFLSDSLRNNITAPASSVVSSLLSPTAQSPRERSRIRTNPWLSANSSDSSTVGYKHRQHQADDTSSGSGLRLTESSGSVSDVKANTTQKVHTERDFKSESLSAGRSPINKNWRIASGMEIHAKNELTVERRNSSSSSGSNNGGSSNDNDANNGSRRGSSSNEGEGESGNDGSSASSITRSGRSSGDDITLNEMMGKFDESYVYEKETDILSDSDPTDCADYIESLSADDENVPLNNDELDYIDNGSFLDLDNLDCNRFQNTGHCTYFVLNGEFARRSNRFRESLIKRRNKNEPATLHRTISVKNPGRKQLMKNRRLIDELLANEKRKRRSPHRRKTSREACDENDAINIDSNNISVIGEDEAAKLNRVLVERMLLKNSGFNQGSRSVGGTPMCLRRKNHAVHKNLSPIRLQDKQPLIGRVDIGDPMIVGKRRCNSVSYVNRSTAEQHLATIGGTYSTTFASEIALLEADKEADKKYRQLILEAENILENMQRNQYNASPVGSSPNRKLHPVLANKRVELIKNTELNIELAFSKTRNCQPELQSGNIRDIEHTSPKRQDFVQPCSVFRGFLDRNITPSPQTNLINIAHSESSLHSRSITTDQKQSINEDLRCTKPNTHTVKQILANSACKTSLFPLKDSSAAVTQTNFCITKSANVSSSVMKDEGVTSSSSDSEERCEFHRYPPLLTFKSVDMGYNKGVTTNCPQSEPVKRKVYAGSATYGRIQKTLDKYVTLRNSDGETATDPDTDDSRKSLKERVSRLRQERLVASTNGVGQDVPNFQQQFSQLRKHMLMQTIQGLKRSLEDQSATLKQTCLESAIAHRLS